MVTDAKSSYCRYVMKDDYHQCSNRTYELETYKNSHRNRIKNISTPAKEECLHVKLEGPCRRLYHLGRLRLQSFGSKTRVQISDMLERCCGPCTKYFIHSLYKPLSEINETQFNSLDIIYPVPSSSKSLTEVHGFYFIPVLDMPNAFYITERKSDRVRTIEMIEGVLKLYPLLIICLLMAFIAGGVIWVMDTWGNKVQFLCV